MGLFTLIESAQKNLDTLLLTAAQIEAEKADPGQPENRRRYAELLAETTADTLNEIVLRLQELQPETSQVQEDSAKRYAERLKREQDAKRQNSLLANQLALKACIAITNFRKRKRITVVHVISPNYSIAKRFKDRNEARQYISFLADQGLYVEPGAGGGTGRHFVCSSTHPVY